METSRNSATNPGCVAIVATTGREELEHGPWVDDRPLKKSWIFTGENDGK